MNEFKSWNSYRNFANRVRRETRYIRTPEDDAFLREILRTSESRIEDLPAGYGLWRTQLGHHWRRHYESDQHVADLPEAYPPHRMKPLPGRATEGRANPKGIPVLYLSRHKETAMSEVRPWLGSLVSCAHFRTARSLKIVNFSAHRRIGCRVNLSEPDPYFIELDPQEREEAVWTQIDHAFSRPITSGDDTAEYAPTQVIAELFKSEGFDGIAYKSAFEEKGYNYNVVLFDPADAELTSCTLFDVKSLKFHFKQSGNPYWVEKDGSTKTAHIADIMPITQSENPDP